MSDNFFSKIKRLLSSFIATAMLATMLPAIPASAEDTVDKYPYTLFAASNEEGAITVNAGNFCVNGNVATNGTIGSSGNMNINGTKTENADEEMMYIFDKIDAAYFSGGNVDEHTGDYTLEEMNINVNIPTKVIGEATLTGNINITTALKAFEDVSLFGEVKNTNDSVIFSKYGDIFIDSTNVNLNGLVYAPFGDVEITAQNLNLNNVVIIADTITLNCPNVNANYSGNAAELVGVTSELLDISFDEWQYLADENNNGFPDFIDNVTNWLLLVDSDEDRLPNCIEEYLKIDAFDADTDDDNIPDGYEVFKLGTEPSLSDSLFEGKTDGEYDFDEDGLMNIEEYNRNTEPWYCDTDNDGLNDGDEVNTYGTNPLKTDTDGDGLEDGDEIYLGTDPTLPDTDGDGILDCDEKFNQTFTHIVENEDCAIEEVIISMEGTGNLQNTTTVESVMNKDVICSDVVGLIGEPFSIESESQFDTATITFKIDQSKLGNTAFDSLMFLWYDEENYEFVELETTYNYEESTVSIETTHFSRYMVVDKHLWFEAWSKELNYTSISYEKSACYSVLAVDCSGSMSSNDPITIIPPSSAPYQPIYSCERYKAALNFVNAMDYDDKAAIVTFESTATSVCGLTDDISILSSSVSKFYNGGGTSFDAAIRKSIDILNSSSDATRKKIILLTDGGSSVSSSIIKEAADSYIKIYTIGLGSSSDTVLQYIADETGGEFFKAYTADELIKIYKEIGISDDFDTTDTDGDGLYDAVETAGIRIQSGLVEGDLIYTDPTNPDSDFDGIPDGEEIDTTIRWKSKYYYPSDVPESAIKKQYYFFMKSNPNLTDSDDDTYPDYDEIKNHKSNPLIPNVTTIEIANPYTTIDTTSDSSLSNYGYGGNQSWFYDENDSSKNDLKSKQLRGGGCGVIASSDTILYMQKYHNFSLTSVNTANSQISYNEYDQFVRSYSQNYLTPFDVETAVLSGVTKENTKVQRPMFTTSWEDSWYDFLDELNYSLSGDLAKYLSDTITEDTGTWGCDPFSLTSQLNTFYNDNSVYSLNYNYYLALVYTQDEYEKIIGNSLKMDVPAIMMVGIGGKTPYMYETDTSMSREMSTHFVTITGINIDTITDKTTLTISTWSHKAYIDLEGFVNNAGLAGGITAVS